MSRAFLLLALALICAVPAHSLSAYVPGATKDKEKKKKFEPPKLQASGGLSGTPTELKQTSAGGLSMPAATAEHTAAPTAVSGSASSGVSGAPGASTSVEEHDKKGTEAVPVKKAPPRLRGR